MVGRIGAALAGLWLMAATAHADDYPNRTIKVVVGFAAGGATDVLARIVAEGLHRTLGQPAIVENRPGANAKIAAEVVAKAPADGYTLMVASVGALAINVHLPPKPAYDTLRDFAPISLLAVNDGVLLVNNDFPAKDFAEFVQVLKAAPGKYGYGTSGVGSPTHLGAELLKRTVGVDIYHVPYKGDSQAINDTVGGHLPIAVVVLASASGQVEGGALRAIAGLGPKRFKEFPNLPTVAESGYPGYAAGSWLGMLAPAGTPPAIVRKLNEAVQRIMNDPAIIKTLEASGSRPAPTSPEEFTQHIKSELTKWGNVIREVGIAQP
jgi:tripartite-type tricarboxylate transporter receptor subunit TctC